MRDGYARWSDDIRLDGQAPRLLITIYEKIVCPFRLPSPIRTVIPGSRSAGGCNTLGRHQSTAGYSISGGVGAHIEGPVSSCFITALFCSQTIFCFFQSDQGNRFGCFIGLKTRERKAIQSSEPTARPAVITHRTVAKRNYTMSKEIVFTAKPPNEEWTRRFPKDPPARQGAKLPIRPKGMKISIAAIAEQ